MGLTQTKGQVTLSIYSFTSFFDGNEVKTRIG
jgi:hypothetical protein